MFASLATIAILAFVAGCVMHLFDVARRWAAWMFLIAGLGVAGFVGRFADTASAALIVGVTKATSVALGAGVAFATVIILGVYLYARMWASPQSAGKLTYLGALMFPTVLTSLGLGGIVAMAGGAVGATGSTLTSILSGIG